MGAIFHVAMLGKGIIMAEKRGVGYKWVTKLLQKTFTKTLVDEFSLLMGLLLTLQNYRMPKAPPLQSSCHA